MGCRSGMGAYEAGRGKIYSVYTVYSLQKARLHHWLSYLFCSVKEAVMISVSEAKTTSAYF